MPSDKRKYPSTIKTGGHTITLRYMSAADKEGILAFAQALPEHDLLFLRRDITEDREVDAWITDIGSGIVKSLIAVEGGAIVGYGTIHRNDLRWSTHVAELRVMVSESMRGKGLGRILTQEAFAVSLEDGIEKMMAQMTLDQKGAISTFEGLGFRPEALLRDHVKDRDGNLHDLLVLSHDVATFARTRAAFGLSEAFNA